MAHKLAILRRVWPVLKPLIYLALCYYFYRQWTLRKKRENKKKAEFLVKVQKVNRVIQECIVECNFACRTAYLEIRSQMSKMESDDIFFDTNFDKNMESF